MVRVAEAVPSLIPSRGRRIGKRYLLERQLARGGMGAIWRATDLELDRSVAIKFMAHELAASASARRRFDVEARAAAQLRSPHVVQIHDHGLDRGVPFIVMEFLDGEDLGTRLNREGRLSVVDTATILVQLARGLRHAHEAGIVHRDLKPSNVFLAQCDDEEIVKIVDFGIAKKIGVGLATDVTRTGVLVGSPHYMSPEQARSGKTIDHRSDLWSVAVIVFRSLTGSVPFPGDDVGDLIIRMWTEQPLTASQLNPQLSPAIDEFFERALARDREARFSSVDELAAHFLRAVGLEDISRSLSLFRPSRRAPEPEPGVSTLSIDTAPSGEFEAATPPTRQEEAPPASEARIEMLSMCEEDREQLARRPRRRRMLIAGAAFMVALAAGSLWLRSPSGASAELAHAPIPNVVPPDPPKATAAPSTAPKPAAPLVKRKPAPRPPPPAGNHVILGF